MNLLVMFVTGAVFAVGCGGVVGTPAAQQPQPLPARGEVRWEPIDEDHVRIWPASGSVRARVSYRMTVSTHCGLDHALDFDGSFWEIETGPEDPWAVLGDPEDQGVIQLESPDIAVYESSGGGVFRLRPVDGSREVFLCE